MTYHDGATSGYFTITGSVTLGSVPEPMTLGLLTAARARRSRITTPA